MTSSIELLCSTKPTPSALGDVLIELRPRVKGLINKKLGRVPSAKIDASDIVQQTSLKVVRCFPNFCGKTRRQFESWVFKIAENLLVDRFKYWSRDKRDMRLERSIDCVDLNFTKPFSRANQIDIVLEKLNLIPEKQRIAIRLRFIDQLKLKEIADHLAVTEDAVAGLLKRGMKRLRLLLDVDGHNDW